jgi:hypothetical protein
MGQARPAMRLQSAVSSHTRIAVDTAPLIYFLVDDSRRAAVTEKVLRLGGEGRV